MYTGRGSVTCTVDVEVGVGSETLLVQESVTSPLSRSSVGVSLWTKVVHGM